MGFTENVNRSSGESQADVQHRLGDAPLARYASRILTGFVQDDLGLPLRHMFDLGEEQDDRLATAQSDDIYAKLGAVSVSEIREMRFGRSEPGGKPVPRFIFSNRAGPIPLAALEDVAGPVDEATGAPPPGAELPHKEFLPVEGVVPVPPPPRPALAVQEYGPSAIPPPPPGPPALPPGQPVAKDGETTGITSETGLYGHDLIGSDEDDEERPPLPGEPGSFLQPVTEGSGGRFMTMDEARAAGRAAVAKEMAVFRRFTSARRKAGTWRDFEFAAVPPVQAHNLNDSGRLAVRKAAGEVAVAGLAVLAADTGRVLMLQRALCDDDPAAGTWEFPGGHIEGDESPLAAAWREWQEETGSACAPGVQTGSWTSGIYQGIVWTIEHEAMVPVRSDSVITNPDDPDADQVEAIAWWDPADLRGNPAVRAELLANIDAVIAALGGGDRAACCGADCCAGGCCDGSGGCTCGTDEVIKAYPDGQSYGDHAFRPTGPFDGFPDGMPAVCHYCGMAGSDPFHRNHKDSVAKAGDAAPKAQTWPGWDHDLRAAAYWADLITAALARAIGKGAAEQLARAYLAEHPAGPDLSQGKRPEAETTAGWLAAQLAGVHGTDLTAVFLPLVPGMTADGYLIGAASAASVTDDADPDWGGWQPGDSDAARDRAEVLGLGAGLGIALGAADGTAQRMADGYLAGMARALIDGASSGLGAAALGAALGAVLADPDTARNSALTVLGAVIGAAAMALYLARKVQRVNWSVDPASNVCPVCSANAAGSPYAIARAPGCPAHPICRCQVVPA